MRRITRRLAAACVCAVASASFTGVALADKATAPGQQKKADTTDVQAAAGVSASVTVAADASAGRSDEAHAAAPGLLKQESQVKQETSASATATVDTSAGVKPSESTTSVMWTQCAAGGTSAAATCTATRSTTAASVKADASKQYGNGATAARIVVGRGGAGAMLTGPGNSQPHKVSACGTPGNPSGGVDVHAVKSYSASQCQTSTGATTQVQGSLQGSLKGSVQSSTTTQVGVAQTSNAGVQVQGGTTTSTSPTTSSSTAGAQTGNGGVLAAHASVTKPAPSHGVLGEVTNVGSATLPFTGFPVWLVALAALGLIGGGLALRRGVASHA